MQPIQFACPYCRHKIVAAAAAAGTSAPCPSCGAKLTVPGRGPDVGATIGGFRIEKLIGAGGMGEVYRARQLSLDRVVALKILPRDPHRSPGDIARFLREVQLLARLDHPNIVTAFEAGEDQGIVFLAMAYVGGEPLDEQLARRGRLPEKDALRISRKIARALSYAWSQHQLLHLDIKPANILLDEQGEPRLADLGLSRTLLEVSAAKDHALAGTPNYMAPEQISGDAPLDFRADIYALGATLFHLVTGELPYAADSVEETLRRKQSESLPDPRTFAPDLSAAAVGLIAGMLGYTPAERYSSWEELIADLDRVLHDKTPLFGPAASVAATVGGDAPAGHGHKVTISTAELRHLHDAHPTAGRRGPAWLGWVAGGIALALAAGAAAFLWPHLQRGVDAAAQSPKIPPKDVTPAEREGLQAVAEEAARAAERLRALEGRWSECRAYAREHPEDFAGRIERMAALADDTRGTPLEGIVRTELDAVREAQRTRVTAAANALFDQVRPLIEQKNYAEAIRLVEAYAGPFAAETRTRRAEFVGGLRASATAAAQAAQQAAAAAAAVRAKLETDLVPLLLRGDYKAALAACDAAPALKPSKEDAQRIERWRAVIERAGALREIIMKSLAAEAGRTVHLWTTQGEEVLVIQSVDGETVRAQRTLAGVGSVARTIPYGDLALREKFQRLGGEPAPQREILRGLLLAEAALPDHARQQFEASGDDLGAALAAGLDTQLKKDLESNARKAFEQLLRQTGVAAAATPAETARAIGMTRYAAADARALKQAVAAFRQAYGDSALAADQEPVLAAAEQAGPDPRVADPAIMEQALKELCRVNPGLQPFPAAWTSTVEGVTLNLSGQRALTQLAPIARLPVSRLNLAGSGVQDFSALRSMTALTALDLSGTDIRSFSFLRGLPLRELRLADAHVTSLNELRGLILETLDISSNAVSSLTPLSGMPLRKLVIRNTTVESLKPLERMPLAELDASLCRQVADLRPLRALPLRKLSLDHSATTDLSPLKDLPLESLNLSWIDKLTDISSLAGLPLKKLSLDGTLVSDLTPLRGSLLSSLSLASCSEVRSAAVLRDLPLTTLNLSRTGVADIAPLAGLPLTWLSLEDLPNLRVVAAPLLRCEKLETLLLPGTNCDFRQLKSHPGLKRIGFHGSDMKTPGEFWAAHAPDKPEKPDVTPPAPSGPPPAKPPAPEPLKP